MLGQVPDQGTGRSIPEGSRVLLSYADKSPALIERVFKGSRTGRVLLWTTPLSRRPDHVGRRLERVPDTTDWAFYLPMIRPPTMSGTTEEA